MKRLFAVLATAAAAMVLQQAVCLAAAPEQVPTPSAPPPQVNQVQAPAPAAVESGADVVLLMDSSGSMKKTDPRGFRKDAARLFVSLLGGEDRAAVVSFGDEARTLAPLAEAGKEARKNLYGAIAAISSRELTTNITAAVKQGLDELSASSRKTRILVLMSDGKLDLGDQAKEEESLKELAALLGQMKEKGIRLYSIAFSDQADTKLLSEMAEQTGGFFRFAATDRDIHLMFAALFEKIKAPDSLVLQGDRFMIDKDVQEAVLLITKQPGTVTALTDPEGKKIVHGKALKGVQWLSAPAFDMITIEQPAPGSWRVKLSAKEGNKVFVLTNLKLKTSFDQDSVARGAPVAVKAWLEKDGVVVTDPDVVGQLTFSADLKRPDGSVQGMVFSPRPAPEAGYFGVEFTAAAAGNYSLVVRADGKTFNRAREHLFRSVEPPAPPPVAKPVGQPSELNGLPLPFAVATIVWLAAMALLYRQVRKYKVLYLKASSALASEAAALSAPAAEEYLAPPSEPPASAPGQTNAAFESFIAEVPEAERITRLLAVIEYQKERMTEVKVFREAMLNTREQLRGLGDKNREIQHGMEGAANASGPKEKEGLQHLSADLSQNNDEFQMFIDLLEREEHRLAANFEQWETEMAQLLKGEELPGLHFREGDTTGLENRIRDLEEQLRQSGEEISEKAAKIKALKGEYEDLEKEYMILYQKHQAAEQQQNL